MDTIRFSQFYNSGTIIHGYVSDSKNYIDSDNLKDIIDKLESIKTNIEKEIHNSGITRYKDYLNAMKRLIEKELELNCKLQNALNKFTNGDRSSDIEYINSAKYILTEELNIIPVISVYRYISFNNVGIFLNSNKKDYTGNKQELFKLIQKEQNVQTVNGESEKERDNRILIQRQLVLKFEHPDDYINEFGDYNYEYIKDDKNDFRYDIKILYKSFMFRSKTRRHFEYLNRAIPYEYTEMKESRKLLHSELRSLYKIFQRRMVDIPLAIAIKNE